MRIGHIDNVEYYNIRIQWESRAGLEVEKIENIHPWRILDTLGEITSHGAGKFVNAGSQSLLFEWIMPSMIRMISVIAIMKGEKDGS